MTTIFQEKTIKFLGKSPNPASNEILIKLLGHPVDRIRTLSFDCLYLRKDTELYLVLFRCFIQDKAYWLQTKSLQRDRLFRLTDTAFRNGDDVLHEAAATVILEQKLYETLPSILVNLESSNEKRAQESRTMVLQLTELFYTDLLNASEQERRNFDKRREWFVEQLDAPIKRYAVHGIDELLQSLLIITKKDFATMMTLANDHRSAAGKRVSELLLNGQHGSYIRLLLSYFSDPDSPAVIDEILTARSDPFFVRKMLEFVGVNPAAEFQDALKRFRSFAWLKPRNPNLPELVQDLEPCAVQLLQASSFPKYQMIELYRFFFERPSVESRRAAAVAVQRLVGDDVNAMLLDFVNNSDAETAATIFRILKLRDVKELSTQLEQLINRREMEIRKAIYETTPEFHIETFTSRINQMTTESAKTIGHYVYLIDPNTLTVIRDDLFSPIPVRRFSACLAALATGLSTQFIKRLIELAETDNEANVRCAALSALSTILTKEAIETIKHLVNDKSMEIRNAATVALRKWMADYQAAISNSAGL
ncbi:MAG: HEAT repeat domain-containing protein [Planctomycetaceae bacterium]|jgi:HEAT repeat protein|nr:HEAT repeat domain-containing protein [Planctomycetaceae bacterium]